MGRRSKSQEERRLEIIDKAWEVCMDYMCSANVPKKEKIKVAQALATKSLPSEPIVDVSNIFTRVNVVIDDNDIKGEAKKIEQKSSTHFPFTQKPRNSIQEQGEI